MSDNIKSIELTQINESTIHDRTGYAVTANSGMAFTKEATGIEDAASITEFIKEEGELYTAYSPDLIF